MNLNELTSRMLLEEAIPVTSICTLSGSLMELVDEPWTSPFGLYDAILRSAWSGSSATGQRRVAELRLILQAVPGLRDSASTELDQARAAYVTHLLTGPTMLSVRASSGGGSVEGRTIDVLTDWRQFRSSPIGRHCALNLVSEAPVPLMLRTTAFELLGRYAEHSALPICGPVQSIMSQVSRTNASAASSMVDLAVACLIPPVA